MAAVRTEVSKGSALLHRGPPGLTQLPPQPRRLSPRGDGFFQAAADLHFHRLYWEFNQQGLMMRRYASLSELGL